jgi:hypothetical protein
MAGWGPLSAWKTFSVTCAKANLPFFDGFESGNLRKLWSTHTTNEGRVRVETGYARTGTYSALLDDSVRGGSYSTAGLILTVNLEGQSDVNLDFWWREFYDENDAADGVFLSDDNGSTWQKVLSFNNGPYSYRNDVIDLDAAASTYGLTFNKCFLVKFQFYDDFPISTDGYSIDDVKVYNRLTAPTLISPSGTISDTTPTYTWNHVPGANKYRVNVYSIDLSSNVLSKIATTSSACSGGTCTYTQPTALAAGTYRFKVKAYNVGGWGPVSTWKWFTISP